MSGTEGEGGRGPRPWAVLGLYAAVAVFYVVVTVAVLIVLGGGNLMDPMAGMSGLDVLLSAFLPQALGLGGATVAAVLLLRWPFRSVLWAPSGVPLWTGVPIALSVWVAAAPLSVWGERILPTPGLEEMIDSIVSGNHVVLVVVALALAPALAEEALFRGVVLSGLRQWGVPMAVGGSAFLFALTHANLTQGLYTMYLGVFFALVALRSRSIWVPVVAHFTANFSSILLMVSRAPEGQDPNWADGVWAWLEGLSDPELVVMLAVGSFAAWMCWRHLPLDPPVPAEAEG